MEYSLKKHGLSITKRFFNPDDLREIYDLIAANTAGRESEKGSWKRRFPGFLFDVLGERDFHISPGLRKLNHTINSQVGLPLEFYNSAFIEIHAETKDAQPGFDWHQDMSSFSVLEPKTSAVFCWFILENTHELGDGTLEFIPREKISEHIGMTLPEGQIINFWETQDLKNRHNIDLTHKGRFLIMDGFRYNVLGYFDEPLEKIAVSPKLSPGDLVICEKDILHRTAPIKSQTGKRVALTTRFIEPDARYNGSLDDGYSIFLQGVFDNSKLWQRLKGEKRGAPIIKKKKAS